MKNLTNRPLGPAERELDAERDAAADERHESEKLPSNVDDVQMVTSSGLECVGRKTESSDGKQGAELSTRTDVFPLLDQSDRSWWPDSIPRWEIVSYGAIFLMSLIVRLWDLGSRAVHHDESLHGFFAWSIFTGSGYDHNPLTHGMFLFLGTAGVFHVFSDSDYTLRLLPALFGAALVLVPLLLRSRMGNIGSLSAALLLAISPSLLYFSRFARNDVIMAVWTLAFVGLLWRYFDERRPLYLYLIAAIMAFGFTTKETQYIVVAVTMVALYWLARHDVWGWIPGRVSLSEVGPAEDLLLLVGTLTLPLLGALSSLGQSVLGITLVASASEAPIAGVALGAPAGGGVAVALFITLGLFITSFWYGLKWNPRVWLTCFVIFYAIFMTVFTTVFTNGVGVSTGIWQSLGYWLAQHEVQRGEQPFYYYFIIASVYEFLPFTVAIGASAYYCLRGDVFTRFLVFWAVATFIVYVVAGEKMPWLMVNIVLPLIILTAKAIGDAIKTIPWQRALSARIWLMLLGVPLFLTMTWRLIFFEVDRSSATSFPALWAMLATIGVLLVGAWSLSRQIGTKPVLSGILLVVIGLMVVLTVRAGWTASFKNGDIPNEMLVYTQTAPDVKELTDDIRSIGAFTGDRTRIHITVDASDGFTWPWAWYLRDFTNAGYPELDRADLVMNPAPSVAIINARNQSKAEEKLVNYSKGHKFIHRWWFPEEYRGLTIGKFLSTIVDPDAWRGSVDYFLYRRLANELGRVDSYVYFDPTIPLWAAR